MSLREKGKERRRQRILDAVTASIRDEGLEGLSTAKIAERAEVSVATLYNLIGSRDEILRALLAQQSEGFARNLEERLSAQADEANPFETVLAYADTTYDLLQKDEATYRAVQKAIFQLNFSRDKSSGIFVSGDGSVAFLYQSLKKLKKDQLISSKVNVGLMVEQMVMAQVILLEHWSLGLIGLKRYRLSCRFNLLLLLKSWAEPEFQDQLAEMALDLQRRITKQDKTDRPRNP